MEGNYYVYPWSSVWKGAETLVHLPPTHWIALWGYSKMHEESWQNVVDKRHWLILKRSRGLCSFKWRCTDSSPSGFSLDGFPVFPTSTISLDMSVQCVRVLWTRTQTQPWLRSCAPARRPVWASLWTVQCGKQMSERNTPRMALWHNGNGHSYYPSCLSCLSLMGAMKRIMHSVLI